VKDSFTGTNKISANSTLVLEGPSKIHNLLLDGGLWIQSEQKKRTIKNLQINLKNGLKFETIDINTETKQHLKIRGYKAIGIEELTVIWKISMWFVSRFFIHKNLYENVT